MTQTSTTTPVTTPAAEHLSASPAAPHAEEGLFESLVEAVAANLHEAWRAPRRLADGTFEPRWKEDGALDIANTAFSDLPAQWQAENLAAARSALLAVRQAHTLEEAADLVHQDWLSRNGEWAPPEQQLPYAQLSDDEQEKDRAVARIAAAATGIVLA